MKRIKTSALLCLQLLTSTAALAHANATWTNRSAETPHPFLTQIPVNVFATLIPKIHAQIQLSQNTIQEDVNVAADTMPKDAKIKVSG